MPVEIPAIGTGHSIADYTHPDLILPCLRASEPAGIIKELSQRLCADGAIADMLAFYHAAINHEFLTHSALPAGIAIPHARSAQVHRLTLAFGRTRTPVVWGAKRSNLIDLVFLLAVPATEAAACLGLLSGIASLTLQPGLLRGIRSATQEREIFELLGAISAQPA